MLIYAIMHIVIGTSHRGNNNHKSLASRSSMAITRTKNKTNKQTNQNQQGMYVHESLAIVIYAFITFQLNYCNTLYAGSLLKSIFNLLMVPNTAARLQLGMS